MYFYFFFMSSGLLHSLGYFNHFQMHVTNQNSGQISMNKSHCHEMTDEIKLFQPSSKYLMFVSIDGYVILSTVFEIEMVLFYIYITDKG